MQFTSIQRICVLSSRLIYNKSAPCCAQGINESVLTFSLDISVGPKIIAIFGTPILFTATNPTTLKETRVKTVNNYQLNNRGT